MALVRYGILSCFDTFEATVEYEVRLRVGFDARETVFFFLNVKGAMIFPERVFIYLYKDK